MRTNILNPLRKRSWKMDRKGQLEMGITMMVLIVFFVLLIIALIVYFKFSYATIKETRQEIMDEKFSTLVNSITGLPELQCSTMNIKKECLDTKKLVAFKAVLDAAANSDIKRRYYEEFGADKLEVEIVYPSSDTTFSGTNSIALFDLRRSEGLVYSTPVSLYDPVNEEYKIGKLKITAVVA